MDILEAIKSRRSVRKYKPDPVDDQALEMVLDAARLAPSWANTQCWRFIIIRDSNIKNRIADSIAANPDTVSNPATSAIRTAPVVIVAVAQKNVSGCFHGKTSTDKGESWLMFDVALAMQNMTLAATAIGLGTVHVGLFDAREVEQILEIPEDYCVVEMTPLGYPEYQPGPRPRKELSEIVFKEKFGNQ